MLSTMEPVTKVSPNCSGLPPLSEEESTQEIKSRKVWRRRGKDRMVACSAPYREGSTSVQGVVVAFAGE